MHTSRLTVTSADTRRDRRTYIHIYININTNINIYININTNINIKTKKQIDIHSDRHKFRDT